MDDLLRSLRNLGLKPPESSQLVELLDEDEQVQDRLIKILSLSSLEQHDFGDEGVANLMGQDLLQEAVKALLDNFRNSVKRQQHIAESERSGVVKKIKWPPRKALLARQAAALQRLQKEQKELPIHRPRLVFDGNESYYSISAITELKCLVCADLKEAPKRYTGGYLLCRVVSPLLLYGGVTFIVDDPTGAALPVSVSHFTSNLNMKTEEVFQMLPLGTIIAIREPFVSLDHQARVGPCLGKGDYGIRVDTPTDILLWDHDGKESIEWSVQLQCDVKELDHNSWLRGRISCNGYTTAREVDTAIATLLGQERPGQAYRQVCMAKQMGIPVLPSSEGKVLFQLDAWEAAQFKFDQAATSLRDYDSRADDIIATDFTISINQLTDSQASLRCQHRIQQAAHGISTADMQSIYFAAAKGVKQLDTSIYIGPIEIQNIVGSGRGMVTTRAVKAGELLLCGKAICPTYAEDDRCNSLPLLRLNLESGVVSTASQVRAQTKLIHAIIDRPELALPILGLTAGPLISDSKYVSQEYPPRIIADLEPDLDEYRRPDVDAKYVDAVLRFNAFGPAHTPSLRDKTSSSNVSERSTMTHPLLAILNHACYPNATSVFFSNIYTTRAICDLAAGTEIEHQYVKGEEPFALRTANLSKHGFQCRCLLCILDHNDGLNSCAIRARLVQGESKAVLDRSAALLKRDSTFINHREKDDDIAYEDIIESLNDLIARIQATYKEKRGSLQPDLFMALDSRAKLLARKSIDDVIVSAKEALVCVGAIVNENDQGRILTSLPRLHYDSCIALILYVATLLATRGLEKDSLRWTETAFWAHQCTVGGGVDVVEGKSHKSAKLGPSAKKQMQLVDVFTDRCGLEAFHPALDLWWNMIEEKRA